MNREIKFRFFDKNDKKMYQAGVLDFDDKKVYMNGYISWTKSSFLLADVELMQSTGLKDKNGVEIYEGDIVKNHNELGYIKYGEFNCSHCNGVYGWVVEPSGYYADLRNYGELEVIGNIYNNPELLEKEGK